MAYKAYNHQLAVTDHGRMMFDMGTDATLGFVHVKAWYAYCWLPREMAVLGCFGGNKFTDTSKVSHGPSTYRLT